MSNEQAASGSAGGGCPGAPFGGQFSIAARAPLSLAGGMSPLQAVAATQHTVDVSGTELDGTRVMLDLSPCYNAHAAVTVRALAYGDNCPNCPAPPQLDDDQPSPHEVADAVARLFRGNVLTTPAQGRECHVRINGVHPNHVLVFMGNVGDGSMLVVGPKIRTPAAGGGPDTAAQVDARWDEAVGKLPAFYASLSAALQVAGVGVSANGFSGGASAKRSSNRVFPLTLAPHKVDLKAVLQAVAAVTPRNVGDWSGGMVDGEAPRTPFRMRIFVTSIASKRNLDSYAANEIHQINSVVRRCNTALNQHAAYQLQIDVRLTLESM